MRRTLWGETLPPLRSGIFPGNTLKRNHVSKLTLSAELVGNAAQKTSHRFVEKSAISYRNEMFGICGPYNEGVCVGPWLLLPGVSKKKLNVCSCQESRNFDGNQYFQTLGRNPYLRIRPSYSLYSLVTFSDVVMRNNLQVFARLLFF